jgi:hypothetical protein
MRAIQALANEQQLAIAEMQDRHDDPDVLQDLLEIDHANAQFGRRAQAIAVLCGSWPGRQRVASPLIDVARGAKSRIRDYRRVEIHSRVDMDVMSRAVEPVVLALAELLDNAARHSQPSTNVEVNIQPAHNGASIVIDDAGVGMEARELEAVGRRLAGREDIDINRFGDPPQFGFSVIGLLAARYGFGVSLKSSSYGGVRAVLFLPNALLSRNRPAGPALERAGAARHSTRPGTAEIAGTAAAAEPASTGLLPPGRHISPPAVAGATVGGLPKRRRTSRSPAATGQDTPAAAGPTSAPARSAGETAARLGAFARGTRFGRDASPDDEGSHQG